MFYKIHCFTTCMSHQSVSSVTQSCLTLCDPMNRNTPGLPVHHQLPEFIQTHAHRVGNAIQPSHPLSSLSSPAPIPPSIRVFSNESTLCMRWPKYWSFSLSISPSIYTLNAHKVICQLYLKNERNHPSTSSFSLIPEIFPSLNPACYSSIFQEICSCSCFPTRCLLFHCSIGQTSAKSYLYTLSQTDLSLVSLKLSIDFHPLTP